MEKNLNFLLVYVRERESEEEEENFQAFFRRSMEFRQLEFIETRIKVHRLDEGYVHIPKRRDFTKDPKEEISKNQIFQAREAYYPCYYVSKGRDSSYFGLFLLFVD